MNYKQQNYARTIGIIEWRNLLKGNLLESIRILNEVCFSDGFYLLLSFFKFVKSNKRYYCISLDILSNNCLFPIRSFTN